MRSRILGWLCCASGSASVPTGGARRRPCRCAQGAEEGRSASRADRSAQRGAVRPAERRGAFLARPGQLRARRPGGGGARGAGRRAIAASTRTGGAAAGAGLLAQQKFQELLGELKPTARTRRSTPSILVARGYAQIGTASNADEAQKSFALGREDRAERGGAAAGRRPAAGGARRPRRRAGQDRPGDRRAAEIARGAAGEGADAAREGRRDRARSPCWTN